MSELCRYCCKSRKSNNPKNLAKADLLDFSGSVAFQSRQEGPWSILDEAIWSLTSPRVKRISGSKNFRSTPQKDFCNNICQQRTHAPQQNYSITSSARTSNEGGTVRPSALAVLRLITNSNLVGCSTGRSEGLVPLRILST
jgi:hypothetical protein